MARLFVNALAATAAQSFAMLFDPPICWLDVMLGVLANTVLTGYTEVMNSLP